MCAAAKPDETPPMSLADWADMDEDEPGELVDGRLEEEEEPSMEHAVLWAEIDRLYAEPQ
jgi:hypothetical protein